MEDQFKSSLEKLVEKLGSWFDMLVLNLPNFIIAVIVFVGFYWLSGKLGGWFEKYLKRFIKQASVRDLIANVSSVVVLAIGLFLALSIMNLDEVLTSLLAGAGVAGLAIGLALQGTISNTFSGIALAINEILQIGDWIETNGYSGKVVEINLRNIKIKEADNNIVVIPNKMVLENPFKNYGLTQRIRTTIHCGVGYDSNLNQVKEIATNAVEKIYPPNLDESVEFHYLSFGDSSIDFQLRFWVDATIKISALEAKSTAIIAIKEAFDQNNIDIPYPIRMVHKVA